MSPPSAEAQCYSASNLVMHSKYATEQYSISIRDCHTCTHISLHVHIAHLHAHVHTCTYIHRVSYPGHMGGSMWPGYEADYTHTHTLDTMHPCYNNQTHYLLYLLYLMSLTLSHPSHPHTSPPPPVHRRNTYCVKRRTNEIQGTLSTAATVAHITRKW